MVECNGSGVPFIRCTINVAPMAIIDGNKVHAIAAKNLSLIDSAKYLQNRTMNPPAKNVYAACFPAAINAGLIP